MYRLGIFAVFIIYMAVWVQFPGMLFTRFLLPRKINWATKLLAGFFVGFAMLAMVYYIETAIKIPGLIMVFGPIFSGIGAYGWLKAGRPSLLSENESIRKSVYWLFALIFIMSFMGLSMIYFRATDGNYTQVYHDYMYHAGNIVLLSRGIPNFDLRVYGVTFYYHYFMELLFGMCKHIFGMDAFNLYMMGNAPASTWPLAISFIAVAERMSKKGTSNKSYAFYLFAPLICCLGVMRLTVKYHYFPISWNNNHMFTNANAIGYAVATTVLALEILDAIWDEKFSWRFFLGNLLISISATGFKGTTGILLVGLTWSVFVIEWIVVKKFSLQKLLYAMAYALGFVLCYVTCVAGMSVEGSNNRATTLSIWGSLQDSAISTFMYNHMGIDYYKLPWTIICMLLCAIFIIGPILPALIAFMVSRFTPLFKEGKIGNIYDWFCIGSILIAEIGYLSVTIEGMSQAYLVLSVTPMVCYCAIKYLEDAPKEWIKKLSKATFFVGILLVVAEAASYVYLAVQQEKVFDSAEISLEDVADDVVPAKTMEGYFWLRDNTPEDSIVAVDIHTESLDFREIYFYCSSFSERQCYIEGFDYADVREEVSDEMLIQNDRFFSEDAVVAEKALEESQIDYLVVTKREHPEYEATSSRLYRCFSNENISVYRFE